MSLPTDHLHSSHCQLPPIFINFGVSVYVPQHAYVDQGTTCGSQFSLPTMSPWDESQVVRVGNKCLLIWNHLTSPDVTLLSLKFALGEMHSSPAHSFLIFRTWCSDFVSTRKCVSYPVQILGRHFCIIWSKYWEGFHPLGHCLDALDWKFPLCIHIMSNIFPFAEYFWSISISHYIHNFGGTFHVLGFSA